jgi:hypothetical protein
MALLDPHATQISSFQETFGINIWTEIVNGHLTRSNVIVNSLCGINYAEFFLKELPHLLEDVPLNACGFSTMAPFNTFHAVCIIG